MEAQSLMNEMKSRWKSQFRISPGNQNDTQYKLKVFLNDVRNFYSMFALQKEENQSQMYPFYKYTETFSVAGLCSSIDSSKETSSKPLKPESLVTEEQSKTINVYFSSLSTSVIVCMTPSRVYELNNLYELGLREATHKILGWNPLGDGILFVQFEKIKTVVKAYLCLANPDNCFLYCKILLAPDSKLNSIRPCLRYLMTSNDSELTRVFGLYFADELKAINFSTEIYGILEYLGENNEGYQRRMSSSTKDNQLLSWIQNCQAKNKNSRTLTEFLSRSKTTPRTISNISEPSNFVQTLHVPSDVYFHGK